MQPLVTSDGDPAVVGIAVTPRLLADILRVLFEHAGMRIVKVGDDAERRAGGDIAITVTNTGGALDGRPVIRVSEARIQPMAAIVSSNGLDRIVRLEHVEDLVALVQRVVAQERAGGPTGRGPTQRVVNQVEEQAP